jgi:serine/threonine-protein kinase
MFLSLTKMKKIGKYEVCGLLGRGGMGTVYKVRMPVIGKIVALKQLKPHPYLISLLGRKEVRRLFVAEALTMAKLRHPNIVDIWDFHDTEDLTFFVMEYYCNNLGVIVGESYRLEMPSRILLVDRVIDYTRQILTGLSKLHQVGIVHRDIKPYNILVTDQNQIKLTDFGLSKLRGESFKGAQNLIVGTPYYAAPEQEKNPDDVDARADLYSVGVLFYRMLTGTLPEKAATTLSQANADLDGAWDAFFEKSTARIPHRRFESAGDMLKALEELEKDWQRKKERVCEAPPGFLRNTDDLQPMSWPLRAQGTRIGSRQAREQFGLDERWRPLKHISNAFKPEVDGTVRDEATGLVWQQAGSQHPMMWQEALEYTSRLNDTRFAGRTTWRLPTVEELLSLITDRPTTADLCVEPVFDRAQRWLWSADRRSFVAAWYVSVELGYVSWQDMSCYYFVRAVSS